MSEMNIIDNADLLPAIALRGLVALPKMQLAFDVGREKSIKAIDAAMKSDKQILLVTQRNLEDNEPKTDALFTIGTICKVLQVLKMPNDSVRILVEPKRRAVVLDTYTENGFLVAVAENAVEKYIDENSAKCRALMRNVVSTYNTYASYLQKPSRELELSIRNEKKPGRLCDFIAANCAFDYLDKQSILEQLDVEKRLEITIKLLNKEAEILSLDKEINQRVHESIDKNQRDFYLREQIRQIQYELNEGDEFEDDESYEEKIIALSVDEQIKKKLIKEAKRLDVLPFGSQEAGVIKTYLDNCLELPFGKLSNINTNLDKARKTLDKDHFGLEKVKDVIIEQLAVKLINSNAKGNILCLVGPPGVGKSSIAKSVARACNREFARISLGGVHDEAEIRGHRKTYVAAMPGRIAAAIKSAGTFNPVILLDEIDKIGSDYKGDPQAALLEVLDPEQNKTFRDNFLEFDLDLSQVLFITTANSLDTIDAPLLDRMEIVELNSYTPLEKMAIVKKHIIPKQIKEHGLSTKNIKFTNDAIEEIIDSYTKEAGVRKLERTIKKILSKVCLQVLADKDSTVTIKKSMLEGYLGAPRYKNEALDMTDKIGVVNGLAYTSVGGELLNIEVNVMEGTGKTELTGSLGDVMKESAKAAISYIRSKADILKIQKDFYKTKDIHIHVPEGAVPKDGPSAGVTITTALISQLTSVPVRADVAMTGEVTLRGRVLAIGGLKEKTMAAYKNKISTVILPKENECDINELSDEVKNAIKFIPVSDMDQVLKYALSVEPSDTQIIIHKNQLKTAEMAQ